MKAVEEADDGEGGGEDGEEKAMEKAVAGKDGLATG